MKMICVATMFFAATTPAIAVSAPVEAQEAAAAPSAAG